MKKLCLSLALILCTVNSAFALQMNGSVSHEYTFGFESILRKKFGNVYKFSKIFQKNDDVFYQNRYTPVYLLSAKDSYTVEPKVVKSNIEKRKVPDTYNLSFKNNVVTAENNINLSLSKDKIDITKIDSISDFETAKEAYQELIEQNPDRIELLYKYGQFLYSNNKYEDALIALNELREKDESFVLASYTMGNIYYDMGEYVEAIRANIVVIKKNPYCADAYFNIASSLEKMAKYNLALDYYQKCVALNANDEQAHDAIRRLEQISLNQ